MTTDLNLTSTTYRYGILECLLGAMAMIGPIFPFLTSLGILIYLKKKNSADLPITFQTYLKKIQKILIFALAIYVIIFIVQLLISLMGYTNTNKFIIWFVDNGQDITGLFLLVYSLFLYFKLRKEKQLLPHFNKPKTV